MTPEENIIPHEVLDLVRFMCSTWAQIDRFVYEHCDGGQLMSYPVVQGTGNQVMLINIGDQPYDSVNITKAIEWMQKYNKLL